MSSTDRRAKWLWLQNKAVLGFRDAHHMLGVLAIVERGNREEIVDRLDNEGADLAAGIYQRAAFAHALLLATRGFAPVRKGDMHLRAMIEASRQFAVEDWLDGDAIALRDAIALFEHLETDERLRRLKHFRDKEVAHIAGVNDALRPRINDLLQFAPLVAEIFEKLAWGTRIVTLSVEGQVLAYKDSADAFWTQWER